jgi:trehalose synthase
VSVAPDHRLATIEDYAPLIGDEAVARIRAKADRLRGCHVAHVNSTMYGGGVAQMLDSLTLLMNSVGLETGWRVIQGAPDYFGVTKKMHNALQGGAIRLTERKREIYESVVHKNAVRTHLDSHDFVVVHDPQPLPLIEHYRKCCPWIWRCHIDLTEPHAELWSYLQRFIERYDAVIVSSEDYRHDLDTPQRVFMPAIDPFSILNREMDDEAVEERLSHHGIPTDLPLVAQVSRFDRWKDPAGVIGAFKHARREVDATLVLLGNMASDDPEGEEVYHELLGQREERIIVISREDTALVNALQRRAAVILQKSRREGFGLTVAEAMFKGTPVIGGNVGGIRHQIEDGVNGRLVGSVEEAADALVELLRDDGRRARMGRRAAASVRERFLLSRLLEQYLDLFAAFETRYELAS